MVITRWGRASRACGRALRERPQMERRYLVSQYRLSRTTALVSWVQRSAPRERVNFGLDRLPDTFPRRFTVFLTDSRSIPAVFLSVFVRSSGAAQQHPRHVPVRAFHVNRLAVANLHDAGVVRVCRVRIDGSRIRNMDASCCGRTAEQPITDQFVHRDREPPDGWRSVRAADGSSCSVGATSASVARCFGV